MKHYNYYITRYVQVLILCALAACGSENSNNQRVNGYSDELKTVEDSLFHQVMEDHNVAMAKMGKLNRYIKQVQLQIDSTKKIRNLKSRTDLQYQATLDSLDRRLREAENSMNTWMEQFNVDSASEANKNRKQYLQNEVVRVKKVKDDILQTLDSADSVFASSITTKKRH